MSSVIKSVDKIISTCDLFVSSVNKTFMVVGVKMALSDCFPVILVILAPFGLAAPSNKINEDQTPETIEDSRFHRAMEALINWLRKFFNYLNSIPLESWMIICAVTIAAFPLFFVLQKLFKHCKNQVKQRKLEAKQVQKSTENLLSREGEVYNVETV